MRYHVSIGIIVSHVCPKGNIGQRDSGIVDEKTVIIQEANTGKMPPPIWADWRVWLYLPQSGSLPPVGQPSAVAMLHPRTDKGSFAFGNPSFTKVPCPQSTNGKMCLFVSYFLFGEGAKPGEAGVVAFYNVAP